MTEETQTPTADETNAAPVEGSEGEAETTPESSPEPSPAPESGE